MAASRDYLDFVLDQLRGFSAVTSWRMFGGFGLYADGFFIGIIMDALYFKVDDSNRQDYAAVGAKPFSVEMGKAHRRIVSMSYFQVPEEVLEDADEVKRWARKALAVAIAAAAQKPAPRPRAKPKAAPRHQPKPRLKTKAKSKAKVARKAKRSARPRT